MVAQMDAEGFGTCTNHGECEAACPKEISLDFIAGMNADFVRSAVGRTSKSSAGEGAGLGGRVIATGLAPGGPRPAARDVMEPSMRIRRARFLAGGRVAVALAGRSGGRRSAGSAPEDPAEPEPKPGPRLQIYGFAART